jgi:hypothetical protein
MQYDELDAVKFQQEGKIDVHHLPKAFMYFLMKTQKNIPI